MLNSFDIRLARERCWRYRRRILDISQQVAALHIGSAYSCAEIVDCIYHGLMRRSADGSSPDTFLMSKGHGCMIQYVILEEHGVLSRADLDAYCTPKGRLGVHPDYGNPGIEAATGSLGHGLTMACGMALAERARKSSGIIYTVLSDGEVQEGSTWEAVFDGIVAAARQHRRGGRQQRFSEPRPHLGNPPELLSTERQVQSFRLGGGRDRRARFRSYFRGRHRTTRRPAVHGCRQNRQREGRQLYGKRADLALSRP